MKKRNKVKQFIRNGLSRILVILLATAVQIALQLAFMTWLRDKLAWIEAVLHILGIIITIAILKNSRHLSTDILWILLINAFPIVGTILYIFLGADLFFSRTYRDIYNATEDSRRYYLQDETIMEELAQIDPYKHSQLEYISDYAGYPVYRNYGFDYYPLGELAYPVILEELRKAKHFIFLEYFIIEQGEFWDSILAILEEKVKEGVDVRVMYDDLGSFFQLPASYYRTLEEKGIKCIPFNRINIILNVIINHRDHRKIMVIDGKVAFSGGINLADEYINVVEKYGKWKDNVIRVKGEAVWSYTVMFLTHWNALRHEDENFLDFKADNRLRKSDGFICPYGETPLDDEICAQNIYMNILYQANHYCYISTPYLIIDTEMINALILCAKRGVDVRIVTPGIPDKKMVYQITRSYYRQLIEGGVKIYEYTPGFNHGKIFISDDDIATVGTVNLDYRSLYLHFENGTLLFESSRIKEIKDDMLSMIAEGHQVSLEESRRGPISEFLLGILRLFAPLM